MERLSYDILRKTGYKGFLLEKGPEKVLQFGEGSFLRAFADYFFDLANEKTGWNGKVAVVQPNGSALAEEFERQEGLYTLYLRGMENGKKTERRRVISAVSRCIDPRRDFDKVLELAKSPELELIVSNTTEAGIVYRPDCRAEDLPPASFPAKLTRVLLERYRAGGSGLVILSCELIDDNGKVLRAIVNRHIDDWALGGDFRRWVNEENLFCSTLVDRIVPGRIGDSEALTMLEAENGYQDELIDVGEPFGTWVIEGPEELSGRLPFDGIGEDVTVVPDVRPYKQRKVRILNGAHTGFALGAYLAGEDIVRGSMENPVIRDFVKRMLAEEITPTLPLDQEDLRRFAEAAIERFDNPFIDHALLSISLNSASKWRARNLPSLQAYVKERGNLPLCLVMSLAAFLAFYSCDVQSRTEDALICRRPQGELYEVKDDMWILDFFWERRDADAEELAAEVLASRRMWGEDLTEIRGLLPAVAADLSLIRTDGALAAFASCLSKMSVGEEAL